MNFLSKHYEKIVLALFLLVFVFSLVYLILVFSKSTEITEADLMVRPEGQNYERLFDDDGNEIVPEGEKPKYAALQDLGRESVWRKSQKRDKNSAASTDLLIPFEAARCPGCHKIIPSISYAKKKCPLCGCALSKIKEKPKNTGGGDSDGDGMPDNYEAAHGLNIQAPSDKWEDKDGDGFPNYTEFKANTKPDDAKSHPPLADRLRLVKFLRNRLNIKLVNVITYDEKDKSKWTVQLKLRKKRRWRDAFQKIGDNLTLDAKGLDVYEIKDVIYKVKKVFDRNLGQLMPKNVSVIILQNALDKSDKPITVHIGKTVYANKVVSVLKDTFTNKPFKVKEDGRFTMGDAATGSEVYSLVSLNIKRKIKDSSVVVENNKGQKFTVTSQSKLQKILKDADVDSAKARRTAPMPGMIEDPAVFDRRGRRSRIPTRGRRTPFDPIPPPRRR